VITVIFGDREWVGRVVAGLAILGYAAYRLASHQFGSLTAVASALVLGVIVLGLFGARQTKPVRIDDKKSL
jgi:4-amino-4-deoxy-L-arabinose transferase-like glycosyltransferase